MIRNLKALGLLAFAALAMSAVFAAGASAQVGTLTAGPSTTEHADATIIGEQYDNLPEASNDWNYIASTPEAFVSELTTCDKATYTGTVGGGAATFVSLAPIYIHCQGEGAPLTITSHGCEYVLTQPTTEPELGGNEYTGRADLTCPITPGELHDRIVTHVYGFGNSTNTSHFFNVCTTEIWPKEAQTINNYTVQELDGHAVYKNIFSGSKDDVTMRVNVSGITSKSNCPGGGEHENGILKTTITVKAFNDDEEPHNTQYDLWISEEEE